MSHVEHISNLTERAVELLPWRWRGANTVQLITTIAECLQPVENGFKQLREGLGPQGKDYLLDITGSWVNQERRLDSDQDFRARVLAQIVENSSGGQREDVLDILRIIGGENIKVWRLGGGWLQINYQVSGEEVINEDQAAQIIDSVLDPGAVYLSSYPSTAFGFAGNSFSNGFGVGQLGISGDTSSGGISL